MATTKAPWILAPPGGPSGPHYGIINGQGRVVAAMIPNVDDAALILVSPELRDVAVLVLDVLAAQQTYFKTRARDDLIRSRQMEAELKQQATAVLAKIGTAP